MLNIAELKKRQEKERTIKAKSAIVAMDIQTEGQITIKQVRLRLQVLGLN